MLLYFIVSPVIVFITTSLLFVILYMNKIRYKDFLWDNLAVIFWSFFYFTWQISTNEADALLSCQLLTLGSIFMPFFFTRFILTYTNKLQDFKNLTRINNFCAILFSFLTFTPLMISHVDPILMFKYWPQAGYLYPIFLIYFMGNFIFSYVIILKTNKAKKLQSLDINFILFSTFIGFIGGATNFPLWFGIEIPPYGNIFLSIYMIVIAYAILKHELMDIRLAITKTFSYIISLSLLCTSFIFPILLINNKIILLASILILSAFWAFNFLPFSNLLITTTKRKFIKGYYEPSKVLLTISDMLVSKTDREKIFHAVLDILDDALELEQSTFIVAVRDKEDKLQGYKILDNDDIELAEIPKNNPLIKYFKNNQSIHRSEDLEDELRTILAELNYTKNSLVFPLHSPELLEGILLLGKRSSGKAYKNEDINFLKQLRAILTSAFYKLTPYEKIENNFLDAQKKLYDAERNLARTERIASLAHLIQEYNHEIKTPLAVLVGLLDKSDLPEDKKKKAYAQTSRIGDIVRTTLRLSSAKEGEKTVMNINDVIEQALYILPLSGVSLNKQLADTPPIAIHGDDLQIMITNLMQNAKEAMPKGGKLTIKTTSNEEHVIITITDTGCGIPEELREKVFEPFFSTHVTKGRGLGLPIVFRIVREHLGTLELISEVNKGTTFIIKLPINN